MVRKKSVSELEKAEIKLESLIERRTVLNDEANVLRQERDLVHEKKRQVGDALRELKGRRSALVGKARAHRAKRDDLQSKAKALIDVKRKLRTGTRTSVAEEVRAFRRQIKEMEMRQQTASLTLSEENKLLDALKGKMARLKELEALKAEEDSVSKEVKDLDAEITRLFGETDREHEAARDLSDRARSLDEELDGLVETVSTLAREGDQHHEAYLEARAKADEVHAKILEMREKVLTERAAKRAEVREGRELLRRQNQSVRRALLDEKKLDESADEALRALLQKGRVEIGR
jgi:uncharacterized coiled-coil DUF342 family protein